MKAKEMIEKRLREIRAGNGYTPGNSDFMRGADMARNKELHCLKSILAAIDDAERIAYELGRRHERGRSIPPLFVAKVLDNPLDTTDEDTARLDYLDGLTHKHGRVALRKYKDIDGWSLYSSAILPTSRDGTLTVREAIDAHRKERGE